MVPKENGQWKSFFCAGIFNSSWDLPSTCITKQACTCIAFDTLPTSTSNNLHGSEYDSGWLVTRKALCMLMLSPICLSCVV